MLPWALRRLLLALLCLLGSGRGWIGLRKYWGADIDVGGRSWLSLRGGSCGDPVMGCVSMSASSTRAINSSHSHRSASNSGVDFSESVSINELVDANGSVVVATRLDRRKLELLSNHVARLNTSCIVPTHSSPFLFRSRSFRPDDQQARRVYDDLNKRGRFLCSKANFLDEWLYESQDPPKLSLAAFLTAQVQRFLLILENEQMQSRVAAFVLGPARIDGRALQDLAYQPDASNEATIERLRKIAAWFRRCFPYFRRGCDGCGDSGAELLGLVQSSDCEAEHCARRTELFHCQHCQRITRFPRYLDVSKVLETRRGRCGEYSVLMLLCLQALGYRVRWVVDRDDHVWVEVLAGHTWTHVDPCEAAVDQPLLYQSWGKNLTFVLSFEADAARPIEDRTLHYTSDAPAVRARREAENVTAKAAERAVLLASEQLRRSLYSIAYRSGSSATGSLE